MTDVFSAATRSYNMSRIRSRWTLQERTIHGYLKGWKVPHTMHPDAPGKPDVVVSDRIAVYLHGCFWHGCPRCYVPPKSKTEYWYPKIKGNRKRDRKNSRAARLSGLLPLQVWEHEIKRDPVASAHRIVSAAGISAAGKPAAQSNRRRSR